ncbi:AMP-binding protein [Rheinheimera maricola]|uniref:AMP-binding protein n=1 Tax=Rheinheimera maricola TaxID=2793282 RepID=A0ABS7X473_9GAMM|nr:AMP-binding protein [Rheinheimera maricola]MBZ9610346.1 AMP-binding protein [Rheinheimera maricola]
MTEPWGDNTLNQSAFFRFKAVVSQYPQRIAFIDSKGIGIRYIQLYQRAAFLMSMLTDGDGPVALYLPYDSDLLCAMLACLALGRPYLPLDPDFPLERTLAIVKHAGVEIVLIKHHDDSAKALAVVVNVVSLCAGAVQQDISVRANADSVAYILYTSGTTGKPKGVYQNQRGLLHDVMQYSQAINISASDCFSGIYSASVNGAIRDIFAALFNGATLVRINPKETGLVGIAKVVAQTGITIFHAIPPLLRSFLNSNPNASLLRSVRLCYIAGDRLFKSDLIQLFKVLPDNAIVYNGIGSTECATLYRHWLIDRNTLIPTTIVPVGYAIAERDTRLHYCDGDLAEVEVISPYLALGYWQEPELTAKAFIDEDDKPGWRRYRPGDLVKVLDSGLYTFVGRADSKVKIRGYLVDLSLLEAELRGFSEVCDVALLTLDYDEQSQLIAVLVGNAVVEPTLKQHLTSQFSRAVVPHYFIWLDALPRLPNFKVDQKKLNTIALANLSREPTKIVSPGCRLYLAKDGDKDYFLPVLLLWLKTLKTPLQTDVTKSFSDLGGDSLDLLNFFAQLDLMLDKPYPLELISINATIEDVITALTTSGRSIHRNSSAAVTLVVVPPFVGFGWAKDFAANITLDIRLVMVPTSALYNPIGEPQPELDEVVSKLCDYVNANVSGGITHFYGVSSGAKPAFFAASTLQAQGMNTGVFIVGDCAPIGRPEHFAADRLQAYSWLTDKIPRYNGPVVEIIATEDKNKHLKVFSVLGWWRYCSKIAYLPVNAEHVSCLTTADVLQLLNSLVEAKPEMFFDTSLLGVPDLLGAAKEALVLRHEALAICYYKHVFGLQPWCDKIYGFNVVLAQKRLACKQDIFKL